MGLPRSNELCAQRVRLVKDQAPVRAEGLVEQVDQRGSPPVLDKPSILVSELSAESPLFDGDNVFFYHLVEVGSLLLAKCLKIARQFRLDPFHCFILREMTTHYSEAIGAVAEFTVCPDRPHCRTRSEDDEAEVFFGNCFAGLGAQMHGFHTDIAMGGQVPRLGEDCATLVVVHTAGAVILERRYIAVSLPVWQVVDNFLVQLEHQRLVASHPERRLPSLRDRSRNGQSLARAGAAV
mmetsp:Transcript_76995/g.220559  ORF Transcript_76995/g.220559 Transcript_76995/m.220559 type:complete len:237 (+) Transcript_76995:1686-2396(+)